jgi:type VI protein secretion system component Hcp
MKRVLDHAAVGAIGLAALALTVPAWAAADYYLKIGDIKGEATESAARPGSGKQGHKDWIELQSLTFKGGVAVAAGDVDGDGRAETRRKVDKATPLLSRSTPSQAPSAPATIAGRDTAEPVGLLVPAVQKVREAAARMSAWRGCAVGQHIANVSLREGASGRVARVLDARVTECAAEQVSFTFSRIEWD